MSSAIHTGSLLLTTTPTTDINTPLTYAQGARAQAANVAGLPMNISWIGNLNLGDVVRAHDNGNETVSDAFCMWTIAKVSN
jgi:hypothetical protein